MVSNFVRLSTIAKKESKWILGLMSGTSLDGLDLALCKVRGEGFGTALEIVRFKTVSYKSPFREEIRKIFAKPGARVQDICFADLLVAKTHGKIINETLRDWNIERDTVDVVASHGQTVYHAPDHLHNNADHGNITLQIGDGDFLARSTGIVTVSDFRQKHIAAGGEGAPLALYGDVFLFSDRESDRILLNIGGIANFTWLPKSADDKENFPFSTDTGPGNTLMDAFMRREYDAEFDEDSMVARRGTADEPLLRLLMDDPFFKLPFPKTTGPELFNLDYLFGKIDRMIRPGIAPEDIMATLNRFSAMTIANAIRNYIKHGTEIYVSGGGAHNPLLIEQLEAQFTGSEFRNTSMLGIDGDAKEAVLFAVLANELLFGNPGTYPYFGKNMPKTTMGKISFP